MKIVLNKCYGGFGLSMEAEKAYLNLIGKKAYFYKQVKFAHEGRAEWVRVDKNQDDSSFLTCLTVDLGIKVSDMKYKKDEYFYYGDIERTDPNLIRVVEELGSRANGRFSELKVVEIPDGIEWEIDEYDGIEHIDEKHNSWG